MGQWTAPSWHGAAGRVVYGARAPVHQTPHHTTPHVRGRSGATRGSSASQSPVVFRPYPPWVMAGAGSGRVPGPKFAAGTAAGAAGGFLGAGRARNPLDFVRCPPAQAPMYLNVPSPIFSPLYFLRWGSLEAKSFYCEIHFLKTVQ